MSCFGFRGELQLSLFRKILILTEEFGAFFRWQGLGSRNGVAGDAPFLGGQTRKFAHSILPALLLLGRPFRKALRDLHPFPASYDL
jgi:hypothetical protein